MMVKKFVTVSLALLFISVGCSFSNLTSSHPTLKERMEESQKVIDSLPSIKKNEKERKE